jgi:hypothetical protein
MRKLIKKLPEPVKARLRSGKKKLLDAAFPQVTSVYQRVFADYFEPDPPPDPNSFNSQEVLSLFPELAGLDKKLNYFVLHASFGDKWFILSLIQEHLDTYGTSRVIAGVKDRGLVELFVGPRLAAEKFIFIEQDVLDRLSSCFRPISKVSTQIADSWFAPGCMHTLTPYLLANGLPSGTIRHLHLCYYPYFNELFNIHAVGYIKLLKTLLYLPHSAEPKLPEHYSDDDRQQVEDITSAVSAPKQSPLRKFILLNAVTISHKPLEIQHLHCIISEAEQLGFSVLVNVALSNRATEIQDMVSGFGSSSAMAVPPRLLALVSQKAHAVIGALGGAMSIAVQFSQSHILSFQTPALGTGFPDEMLYANRGKGNLWKWADEDWPCLHPGRIMQNEYVGDPEILPCEKLAATTRSFLQEVTLAGADAQSPSPC